MVASISTQWFVVEWAQKVEILVSLNANKECYSFSGTIVSISDT